MQSRLLCTALLAAAAAWLLSDDAAPAVQGWLRGALVWTAERFPQVGLSTTVLGLDLATTVVAVLLLILIPVIWLKPT
ncbi:hypothetical protein KBY96_06720 [Cyanobium sp. ATX 6A2]|uniref:hypothetical protein n=1 Tax=Cyanobium sp. ATX 6A2 TaxID=2823700 RepID=UPI0020CC4C32|nr:hypothetical protein [Cyanobium sp. ATX 6A2]MCP9887626.1 hypothetical protein [Cyanobium sp. ATX 6A2]